MELHYLCKTKGVFSAEEDINTVEKRQFLPFIIICFSFVLTLSLKSLQPFPPVVL